MIVDYNSFIWRTLFRIFGPGILWKNEVAGGELGEIIADAQKQTRNSIRNTQFVEVIRPSMFKPNKGSIYVIKMIVVKSEQN